MQPGTAAARGLAACALVAASSLGAPAWADDVPDAARPDELLREGRRLLAEGKIVEACAKLSAGHRLAPAAGTALEVGDCFAKAGKTGSARAAFDEARALAKRGADEAERRLKALEERQPTVILEAPGGVAPGTVIRIDGMPIDPAATGTPIPLEPGPHLVEVSRGGSTWTARVEVEATGAVRVPLPGPPPTPRVDAQTPRVEPPPVQGAPQTPGTEDGAAPEAHPRAPSDDHRAPAARPIHWEAHRVSGVVVGSVGVVALITGAAFGVAAIVKKNASNDGHCNASDYCDATGLSLRADAMRAGVVSTATLFAGAAATASGIALFFTAPAPDPTGDRARVGLGLSVGPGSMRLTGRW